MGCSSYILRVHSNISLSNEGAPADRNYFIRAPLLERLRYPHFLTVLKQAIGIFTVGISKS